MTFKSGNFGRGYALMEFILEDCSHTLKEAAKEFRISENTARADINCAGYEAVSGYCKNPEKVKAMFVATKKQLQRNSCNLHNSKK